MFEWEDLRKIKMGESFESVGVDTAGFESLDGSPLGAYSAVHLGRGVCTQLQVDGGGRFLCGPVYWWRSLDAARGFLEGRTFSPELFDPGRQDFELPPPEFFGPSHLLGYAGVVSWLAAHGREGSWGSGMQSGGLLTRSLVEVGFRYWFFEGEGYGRRPVKWGDARLLGTLWGKTGADFVTEPFAVEHKPVLGQTRVDGDWDESHPVLVMGRVFEECGLFDSGVVLGGGRDDFVDPFGDGSQYWYVDGEELAAGGVEAWLVSMMDTLRVLGVELVCRTVSGPDRAGLGYVVEINGVEVVISAGKGRGGDSWTRAQFEPGLVVNRLLAGVGSSYRLMLIAPGSQDGMAIVAPHSVLSKVRRALLALTPSLTSLVPN